MTSDTSEIGTQSPIVPRGVFGGWELVSLSWEILSHRLGLIVLAHLVVFLIIQGAYSTFIGGIILAGPVWYGLCLICLNLIRGQEVKFDQLFSGFQDAFMPLMIVSIIMHIIAIVANMIIACFGLVLGMMTFFGAAFSAQSSHAGIDPFTMYLIILAWSAFLVALLLPAVVLIVLYAPVFFIYVDEPKLDAWAAMEKSRKMVTGNWPRWRNLWVALSIIHLLGILACCLGYFVVTPWMVIALGLAYERSREPIAATVPPPMPQV